jgi:hypothetical protein
MFKDSGTRQNFKTGARRDVQRGKGRMDLTPPFSEMFIACVYETGCIKYGDRNWEKGIPIGRYLDSAKRHILKHQAGLRDEPHLSMACWNLMCALWTGAMVELKLRPASLNNLVSHVGGKRGKSVSPLSEFELQALETFIGKKLPRKKKKKK